MTFLEQLMRGHQWTPLQLLLVAGGVLVGLLAAVDFCATAWCAFQAWRRRRTIARLMAGGPNGYCDPARTHRLVAPAARSRDVAGRPYAGATGGGDRGRMGNTAARAPLAGPRPVAGARYAGPRAADFPRGAQGHPRRADTGGAVRTGAVAGARPPVDPFLAGRGGEV